MKTAKLNKIDSEKTISVSTDYNIVKRTEVRPESGSEELLIFIKNEDGVNGSILRMLEKNYITEIKRKCSKDIKEINEEIKKMDIKDPRVFYLELAKRNILESKVYILMPEQTQKGFVYHEIGTDRIKTIIGGKNGV